MQSNYKVVQESVLRQIEQTRPPIFTETEIKQWMWFLHRAYQTDIEQAKAPKSDQPQRQKNKRKPANSQDYEPDL
ncbi:MAG: hypothetical protein WCH05_06550 [Chlorobiaceae bacterium]